jgi:hypothetical protein
MPTLKLTRKTPDTVWIGLPLDPSLVKKIRPLPEDKSNLYLKLANLGPARQREDWMSLIPVIERLAVQMAPLYGEITSFASQKWKKDNLLVALVSMPGLELFRRAVIDTIALEFPVDEKEPWQAQIILDETKNDNLPEGLPSVPVPISFDLLTICTGDESYELPLLGL